MRVYISGPITGIPEEEYMKEFHEAAELLKSKGYSVIDPALIGSNMPEDTTYDEFMKLSYTLMDMCDAVYMMEGWKSSKGCNLELQYAREHGIEIIKE